MSMIKNAAKELFCRKLYTDYHFNIINDSIVLDIPDNSVSGVRLKRKKYRITDGKARIPVSKANLNEIEKNGISLIKTIGGRAMVADIPGSNVLFNSEGISLNGKTYFYNGGKLLRIKDIQYARNKVTFTYSSVLGDDCDTSFRLADNSFNVLTTKSIDEKGEVQIFLEEDENRLLHDGIQLIAIQDKELIPLIAEGESESDGLRVISESNRIYLNDIFQETYSFKTEKHNKKSKPLYSDASLMTFDIINKDSKDVAVQMRSNQETDIVFFWKNILTGETFGECIFKDIRLCELKLWPYIVDKRKPFEKAVLMYSIREKEKADFEDYVHLQQLNHGPQRPITLADGGDNQIIRDVTGIILLESSNGYTEHKQKALYDFSKYSFKANISDIHLINNSLVASLEIQSFLLPITSVVIMARNLNTGFTVCLKELVPDEVTTVYWNKIDCDLTEIYACIENEGAEMTLMTGLRYAGGYSEEGYLTVSDNAGKDERRPATSENGRVSVITDNSGCLCLSKDWNAATEERSQHD